MDPDLDQQLRNLKASGIRTVHDFLSARRKTPRRLASLCTLPEVEQMFIDHHSVPKAVRLSDLTDQGQQAVLSTGSADLDSVLEGGGFRRQRVYEVFGPPGSGKTQLLMQLAASCCTSGRPCIYVDTKNDFVPERLSELAAALLLTGRENEPEDVEATVEDACDKLFRISKAFSLGDLLSCFSHSLTSGPEEAFLGTSGEVYWETTTPGTGDGGKPFLLAVDNMASLLLPELDSMPELLGQVARAKAALKKFAYKFDMAVVFVNQSDPSGAKPALGKLLEDVADVRLMVETVPPAAKDDYNGLLRKVTVTRDGRQFWERSTVAKKSCVVALTHRGYE